MNEWPRPTGFYPRSLDEWVEHLPMQPLKTSAHLGWNNVTLHAMQINPNPEFYPSPEHDNHFFQIILDGTVQMQGYYPDKGYFDEKLTIGSLGIIPRRTSSFGRWDSSAKVVLMEIPQILISDLAASAVRGDPDCIELRPMLNGYDATLFQLGKALHAELQNGSLLGMLYAESVANAAVLHLLHHYSNASFMAQADTGKLSIVQVRLINEYIYAHLYRKISLSEMANLLHLSIPHFERMFRATINTPPYHYVLERRIEKAKFLLQEGRLSIASIALECGFANQSHFTRHFTKLVGVSPARFRHNRLMK